MQELFFYSCNFFFAPLSLYQRTFYKYNHFSDTMQELFFILIPAPAKTSYCIKEHSANIVIFQILCKNFFCYMQNKLFGYVLKILYRGYG